jgi:hypothetical protein
MKTIEDATAWTDGRDDTSRIASTTTTTEEEEEKKGPNKFRPTGLVAIVVVADAAVTVVEEDAEGGPYDALDWYNRTSDLWKWYLVP